jgi:hypothetical protein
MAIIDKKLLLAGLLQLNRKYAGKLVDRVIVQMVNGKPAYIMQGSTPNPPPGLPGTIQLLPGLKLPIIWAFQRTSLGSADQRSRDNGMWNGSVNIDQGKVAPSHAQIVPKPTSVTLPCPNEQDLDNNMWYGYVNIDRKDVVTVYQPGADTITTQQEIPHTEAVDLQVAVDVNGPLGWWDLALELEGCLCCSFYNRPVTLLNYVVPQDRVLYIDSWSFFVYMNLPVGWAFNVRFLRDGDTLLAYDEIVVDPTNVDPALRCLFSGSTEQVMNSYLRIDRGQTLSVVITPKGLYPYINDPMQSVCGNICALLHGHSTALLDNRDGAPRPKDVGAMRDDVTGSGLLSQVTREDVNQLIQWLNGATTEAAAVPSTVGKTDGPSSMTQIIEPPNTNVLAAQQSRSDKDLTDAATSANSKLLAAVLVAAGGAALLGESAVNDDIESSTDEYYGSSLNNDPFVT